MNSELISEVLNEPFEMDSYALNSPLSVHPTIIVFSMGLCDLCHWQRRGLNPQQIKQLMQIALYHFESYVAVACLPVSEVDERIEVLS